MKFNLYFACLFTILILFVACKHGDKKVMTLSNEEDDIFSTNNGKGWGNPYPTGDLIRAGSKAYNAMVKKLEINHKDARLTLNKYFFDKLALKDKKVKILKFDHYNKNFELKGLVGNIYMFERNGIRIVKHGERNGTVYRFGVDGNKGTVIEYPSMIQFNKKK